MSVALRSCLGRFTGASSLGRAALVLGSSAAWLACSGAGTVPREEPGNGNSSVTPAYGSPGDDSGRGAMRTGTVQINGSPPNPDAPFGGYKQSGVGREMGREGFLEYLETKTIGLPA